MALHASIRYVKVLKEGVPVSFFVTEEKLVVALVIDIGQTIVTETETEPPKVIYNAFFWAGNIAEDIFNVHAMELDVNDDNDTAPENIPEVLLHLRSQGQ